MLINYVSSSKRFSNIIYERKGTVGSNRDFVERYLSAFPDAFLDYKNRIIVDNSDGINIIYFRDDFTDEENYIRLYNYILTGNDSYEYYLRSKAEYLHEHDLEAFYTYFESLSRKNQETVLNNHFGDYSFDLEEYLYRTLIMGELHESTVRQWLIESEYKKIPDVLEQNEEWLKMIGYTDNELYVNNGNTLFDLVDSARKVINFIHGDYYNGDHNYAKAIQPCRNDEDLEFLFRDDRERYYEKLSERIPFVNEHKEKLMKKRETFQECLYRLMGKYGVETVSELTATKDRPGVSKAVMSKWINNKDPNRTPDKNTVYTIIMSAHLDMDDAIDLLNSAKLEFGSTDEDIIVRMFIDKKEYDLQKLDYTVLEITGRSLLNRKV